VKANPNQSSTGVGVNASGSRADVGSVAARSHEHRDGARVYDSPPYQPPASCQYWAKVRGEVCGNVLKSGSEKRQGACLGHMRFIKNDEG